MSNKRTKVMGVSALVVAGTLVVGAAGQALAGRGDGDGDGTRARDGSGGGWRTESEVRRQAPAPATPSAPVRDGQTATAGQAARGNGAEAPCDEDGHQVAGADRGRGAGGYGPAAEAPGQRGDRRMATPSGAAVTPELEAMLQRAMVDEVGALTTYEVVVDELGRVVPFVSLARSEATHVVALDRLADRLGIELDEVTPPEVEPPASLDAACAAAVAIEEADIALYDELLPQVQDWPSVVRVLTNLRAASERHLAAATECG